MVEFLRIVTAIIALASLVICGIQFIRLILGYREMVDKLSESERKSMFNRVTLPILYSIVRILGAVSVIVAVAQKDSAFGVIVTVLIFGCVYVYRNQTRTIWMYRTFSYLFILSLSLGLITSISMNNWI